MMYRGRAARRFVLPTCEPLTPRVLLFGGDLDTTFSNDGMATMPAAFGAAHAAGVGVQSDGKVVVAGESTSGSNSGNMIVTRFNTDGSTDTSFGVGGYGGTGFTEFQLQISRVNVTGMAVQSDNKIVVVGWANRGANPMTYGLIARFNADGSLDSSFNNGGKVVIQTFDGGLVASVGNQLFDVAIQADGKIVVAGSSIPNDGGPQDECFAVANLNTNGTFDSSFHSNGTRLIGVGDDGWASSVALTSTGKIVLVGSRLQNNGGKFQAVTARLNADGGLDTSFSSDGIIVTEFDSSRPYTRANDAAVQPDGKIVIAGSVNTTTQNLFNFAVMRLNTDGSLDSTFGTGGKTELDLNSAANDSANSILIGKAGKLIVGGYSGSQMIVACVNTDGTIDEDFARDGTMNATFAGGGIANGLAIAPGGKIVAAGGENMATVRFFDRAAASISVGTFNSVMNEAGETQVGLIVGRLERLPTSTRVFFTVGGTARRPNTSGTDYVDDNVVFFNTTNVAYVDVPANTTFVTFYLTAVDDPTIEGDETASFIVNPLNNYDVFPSLDRQTFLIRDNDVVLVPPKVTATTFDYEHVPNKVTFRFDQDVGASLALSDFDFTGVPAGVTPMLAYDASLNTATITFSTPALPAGNYSISLPAGRVSNTSGTASDATSTIEFFSLPGDANRDRVVNFADLLILAQNYGESNRSYSHGDFNDDLVVNFTDLLTLAQAYGSSVLVGVLSDPQSTSRRLRNIDLIN